MGPDVSLTLLSVLGTIYLLLGCVVQLHSEGFCFVLLYHILSHSIVVSWKHALFLRELGVAGKSGERRN